MTDYPVLVRVKWAALGLVPWPLRFRRPLKRFFYQPEQIAAAEAWAEEVHRVLGDDDQQFGEPTP